MTTFCIPADFKKSSIDSIMQLISKHGTKDIRFELYGSLPVFELASGRKSSSLPKYNKETFVDYLKYLNAKGIDFYYTLNAITLENIEYTHAGYQRILDTITELRDAGIKGVIVSIPPLIEIINQHFPKLEIIASAICKIDSVSKALEFISLGADRIVLFEDSTRDFSLIKNIAQRDIDIEIIVNQDCQYGCISRDYHRVCSALYDDSNISYNMEAWLTKCKIKRLADPSSFLKTPTLIKPKDLSIYREHGVEYFKIVGREFYWNNIEEIVKVYVSSREDGNFFDIIPSQLVRENNLNLNEKKLDGFLDFFVTDKNQCIAGCLDCGHCNKYADNIESTVSEQSLEQHKDAIQKFIKRGNLVGINDLLPKVNLFWGQLQQNLLGIKHGLSFDALRKCFVNVDSSANALSPTKWSSWNQYYNEINKTFRLINNNLFNEIESIEDGLSRGESYDFIFLDVKLNKYHNGNFLARIQNLLQNSKIRELAIKVNIDDAKEEDIVQLLENFHLIQSLELDFGTLENNPQRYKHLEIPELRVKFELNDNLDLEKIVSSIIPDNAIIVFDIQDDLLLNTHDLESLYYKMELIHRVLLSQKKLVFESMMNIPFLNYIQGTTYQRFSPRWKATENMGEIAKRSKEQCITCQILPLCLGHYIRPDSDLKQQVTVCNKVKELFIAELKYHMAFKKWNKSM